VSQQIDPVPPEMRAQRLDIAGQPVTPVTRRVRRHGRFPGPAQVKQRQRAVRGQPGQVTEVCRGLHGAAGKADQRVTLAGLVVDKPRAVGTVEGCHAALVETRLKRMQYRPGLLGGFLASTGPGLTPFRNPST
jgi:hypothetical protein